MKRIFLWALLAILLTASILLAGDSPQYKMLTQEECSPYKPYSQTFAWALLVTMAIIFIFGNNSDNDSN